MSDHAIAENRRIWSRAMLTSLTFASIILALGRILYHQTIEGNKLNLNFSVYKILEIFASSLNPEVIDKLIWVTSIAIVGLLVIPIKRIRSALYDSEISFGSSIVSLTFLAVSILSTPIYASLKNILWFGFGKYVLLATCMFSPFVYYMQKRPNHQLFKWIVKRITALSIIVYFPTMIQPLGAIKDAYHSSYVINEVIAPVRGIFPTADMAAQYANIMGIPYALLARVFGIDGPIQLQKMSMMYLSVLTVITFALLCEITRRVTPKELSRLLTFVPLALVLVTPNGSSQGTITSLLSAVPIRTLPVFLLGFMLIHRSRRHTLSALAIGFMAGGASINNLEFGVPAVISVILVEVILGWQLREKLKRVIFVISGVLISWLLFVLLLSVSGRRFKLENYSLFVRLFGGGLLQEPMPTFGPHIFVISIFVSGIAVGTLQLLRAKHSQDSFDSEGRTMNAAITAVYFGLIGLGTFPYFVNRSVISGQLQIFLLFVAPIIASSFSLLRLGDYRITNRRNTATLLVMVFPQSLLFGSIFQMPNGVNEWNRVINPQAMTYSNHLSEVESAIAKAEVVLNSQIELFSISHGNLFLGSSDVRNISLIDNPAELNNPLARGSGLVQLFCRNMDTYSVVERQLILVENFFETESGLPLCRNYRKVLAVSEKFSVVVRAS